MSAFLPRCRLYLPFLTVALAPTLSLAYQDNQKCEPVKRPGAQEFRPEWAEKVLSIYDKETKEFWERASDKGRWPRAGAPQFDRCAALGVVSAISGFESNNNPQAAAGVAGVDKIASPCILQIQARNCGQYGISEEALRRPDQEACLRCGMKMMARLLSEKGCIGYGTGGSTAVTRHGNTVAKGDCLAGGGWSVMYPEGKKVGGMNVGHLEKINQQVTNTPPDQKTADAGHDDRFEDLAALSPQAAAVLAGIALRRRRKDDELV